MDVTAWLLDADPAIRWQVLRSLTDAPVDEVDAERARVPREGVGAAILAAQGGDGAWHLGDEPDWVPTLYTMQLLRATGVDPADPAVDAAIDNLAAGFRWHEQLGGKPFFDGETEPCINGGALALGGYFERPSHALAAQLITEQLADGGWNCEAPKSARSSFHSTICVLEGLLAYERAAGATPATAEARRLGEAYVLSRQLFRRRSTGEVVAPSFTTLAFPPRCYYDVLRGLDYLRDAGVAPDARMADAVAVLRTHQQPDGRWLLEDSHAATTLAVAFDEAPGQPSRWNTLRALRVLRWFDAG
ncbi:MAG TPA: hypothetical protein VGC42_00955 [Kofleriaceae bacterium]